MKLHQTFLELASGIGLFSLSVHFSKELEYKIIMVFNIRDANAW